MLRRISSSRPVPHRPASRPMREPPFPALQRPQVRRSQPCIRTDDRVELAVCRQGRQVGRVLFQHLAAGRLLRLHHREAAPGPARPDSSSTATTAAAIPSRREPDAADLPSREQHAPAPRDRPARAHPRAGAHAHARPHRPGPRAPHRRQRGEPRPARQRRPHHRRHPDSSATFQMLTYR